MPRYYNGNNRDHVQGEKNVSMEVLQRADNNALTATALRISVNISGKKQGAIRQWPPGHRVSDNYLTNERSVS